MDSIVADRPARALARAASADPLTPTVFHARWWLDAACEGWEEVTVSAGSRVVGRFPYLLSTMPFGQAVCGMPALAHFLGPAVDEGEGAACNRALRRAQITRELLDKMPRASGFYHKMHRDVADTMVFQERGLPSFVQFTFEIAPAPEAAIWRGMRDKTRNVIRRAGEALDVCEQPDVDAFLHQYQRNINRRGVRNRYPPEWVRRGAAAALARGQGRIWSARARDGSPAAAIFCLSDRVSTYYLLTTRTPEAGNGAVALLLWHAIRESAASGRIFDFDGVPDDGSRLFFTGFGGQVRPRYIVSRFTLAHRAVGRLVHPWRRRERTTFC